MKKTKIVCTIGPASLQMDILERMIGAARAHSHFVRKYEARSP